MYTMSGEIEAMGALATGGLVARALGGEGHAHGHTEQQVHDCQNCGAMLSGPFCHACGQSGHVHRTLGHVVEEFAHGVFHVESKGWRTLPMLVVNPGRLTREYIHGKRARYIAPLALFLFMVFLTFFTFGMTGGSVIGGSTGNENQRAEAASELRDAERELKAAMGNTDTTLAQRQAIEKIVASARAKLAHAPEAARPTTLRDAKGKTLATGANWAELVKEANANGNLKVNTGYDPFDKRVHHALENPEFAAYKVEQKSAKLSFLLVPLSLPVLWLLFARRRGVNLYDHTVFALYSLSFMSLLVVSVLLVNVIGLAGVAPFLLLLPPVHMFLQLKGGYGLTTGGALWRTAILAVASMVVLALFFLIMLFIGLVD